MTAISTKKPTRSIEKSGKEFTTRQSSVGAKKNSSDNQQKPTISTTFHVDRLLNKLTSPRVEPESRTPLASNTPNISKDYSNRLKESGMDMRIEKLLYGENYVNSLDTNPVKSPSTNQQALMAKPNNQSNRIKISDLLNLSPSIENQMNLLMKVAPELSHYPNNFNSQSTRNKPERQEASANQRVPTSPDSLGGVLSRMQHNRFPSANPDKRAHEDTTLTTKGPSTVAVPMNIPVPVDANIFRSIEAKHQSLMQHLSPSTRKFTNPVPHAYRLPTETDEKRYVEPEAGDLVTVDYEPAEADEEYDYRPTLISNHDTLLNSRNRAEELSGSFGFSGLSEPAYRSTLAKNSDLKEIQFTNDNRTHIYTLDTDEGGFPATHPTLTYSRDTQETLGSATRVNISEFRNSLFRAYDSEQVVPEEPSCMEKSNPTTFRKVDSLTPVTADETDNLELISYRSNQDNETNAEDKQQELFGFNPSNLSETTRTILSSIINNISLEKNLPNLSKHLKKHSISRSSKEQITQSQMLTEPPMSVQDWVTESSTIMKPSAMTNQTASHIRQTQEEDLDTSRNPVLYDDLEGYNACTSNTFPENDKVKIIDLFQTEESLKFTEDEDVYVQQVPSQAYGRQSSGLNDQHVVGMGQESGFLMQNDFSLANQVCTPEYGYKFQSRTGKEGTSGQSNNNNSSLRMPEPKNEMPNAILASFGGLREQLYDRFSIGNSQNNISLQSPELFDSKMMQSLTDLLPSKDMMDSMRLENYKYLTTQTEGSVSQTDSQVFRDPKDREQRELLVQRESAVSMTANCNEKLTTQQLKESSYLNERVSATSERLSISSSRVENRMITVHSLRHFCEKNQIYAENLVDEIFRYLNEYLVNKNYFVQILTNYLNCFPQISQSINHQDLSNKIFEISDRNNDGIISINDLGDGCLLFCQKLPISNPEVSLLYSLLDTENKGFILEVDIVNLLTREQSQIIKDQGKYFEQRERMEPPRQEAARLFRELDKERRGILSYWDIYMWKDIYDFTQFVQRMNQHLAAMNPEACAKQTAYTVIQFI